ncbi:response regulator [Aliarcobacter cryaerophilus]|uniref:response regulator n=1 Tax=Aliarcobacter cryaerophilus TaxID=28198 RepID=UPI0021B67203|nr:response regulator [Aliarcobacter cryaerophilus]MCT7521236.1 response regulator [Aliarcobacter cryaerophilus]
MKIKDYSILIVEDEFIASEYLYQILDSFGIETIFKAKNSNEALEVVKNNHIDLVFMDINIQGGIDGIKCSFLLNQEYFIPVIFATAYSDTRTINEAKDENIFGYLIKPFQISDVEATLSVAISNINRIRKLQEPKKDEEIDIKKIDLSEKYIYYFDSKTLTFNNCVVALTKKELEVLDILCKNINKNISYEYLKDIVWINKDISDSTVRDVVSRLKKKLDDINIENISNFGYVLKK